MPPSTPVPKPSLLGVFWFGIQVVWGALLGVSLQARASQLAPHNAIAAYGTIAVCGAAAAAFTQIGAGIVSDRRRARGSRRVEFYALGALGAAAALVWFYLAPDFVQLAIAVVAVQVAMNVAIGPYQAAIPDFMDDRGISSAASWMAVMQSLGNAAGALVAGLIADARIVAGAVAGTLAICAAITGAHVRALPLLGVPPERLRVTRSFADLFISRALVFVGFYTLLGYLFFYVERVLHVHNAPRVTGLLILAFTAAGAAGAALGGMSKRADRRVVAGMGCALFAVCLLALLMTDSIAATAPITLVAGAAWGLFLTADWALGCRFLPRGALATGMGLWNLALLGPQIAAPALTTGVLTALHALATPAAPRIALLSAAAEVAAGALWLARLPAPAIPVERR